MFRMTEKNQAMAEEDTLHQTGISEKKENLIIEDLKEEKIGLAEANQKTLEEEMKEEASIKGNSDKILINISSNNIVREDYNWPVSVKRFISLSITT